MKRVFFEIASPQPLASREDGRRVLGLWMDVAPQLFPDRWGVHEPVKAVLSRDTVEEALTKWEMTFLLKRVALPRLTSGIRMQYGPHRRHSTWSIDSQESLSDYDLATLLKLFRTASLTISADFGFIHSITESEIERGRSSGTIFVEDLRRKSEFIYVSSFVLQKYIPDIYWMTIFGTPYVEMLSEERLLSAPVHKTQKLADGSILLQLTPCLKDIGQDEVAFEKQRQLVREHLNNDAFYDPARGPEAKYRVPKFAWQTTGTITDFH